jgi:hypothetical protein
MPAIFFMWIKIPHFGVMLFRPQPACPLTEGPGCSVPWTMRPFGSRGTGSGTYKSGTRRSRDTSPKGRIVQRTGHPRLFVRGYIGRGHFVAQFMFILFNKQYSTHSDTFVAYLIPVKYENKNIHSTSFHNITTVEEILNKILTMPIFQSVNYE